MLQLVKYAGFGAKVVGYDAYPNNSLDFLEYKDTVEEAIADADIISLHVPANKEVFFIRCRYNSLKLKRRSIS